MKKNNKETQPLIIQSYSKDLVVAGVDEAGRGPLAGPVIAAAVILNPDKVIEGLTDSKLLTAESREMLFAEIYQHALAVGVGRADVPEIDQLNILHATMLAMQRAVADLAKSPELVLVDGNRAPKLPYPSEAIIKGDLIEPAISAASIIAKVTRDREMVQLDQKYPHYLFAKHKGYATKDHFLALQKHGPCEIHRVSFSPVKETRQLKECDAAY